MNVPKNVSSMLEIKMKVNKHVFLFIFCTKKKEQCVKFQKDHKKSFSNICIRKNGRE